MIAFEYPGYGLWKSTTEAGEQALHEAADEVWSVVTNSLGVKPNNVVLFGRSLGAAVVCAMAARHQDVGGLVMLSPFASIREVAKQARLSSTIRPSSDPPLLRCSPDAGHPFGRRFAARRPGLVASSVVWWPTCLFPRIASLGCGARLPSFTAFWTK